MRTQKTSPVTIDLVPVLEPSGQVLYITWDQAALLYFGEKLVSLLAGVPWKIGAGWYWPNHFGWAGGVTAPPSTTVQASMKTRQANRFLRHRSYWKLLRLAAEFIDSLRDDAEFARALNVDPLAFRGDLIRAIRAQLCLRRGRHSDPRLDQACDLLSRGASVATVLQSQIPDFEACDPYTRYLAERGLRQAAARRRKWKKPSDSRKNPHQKFTATNRRRNRPTK